ncbi:MAG: bifunctional (p)ppGpp synthetase/guanosine-3',5'-bis(diphosphate) 3'-pyrophosphohydrolase [Bifidobacterium sp.]|jgi:(p)ppGpp synthase/HD superfamily hydrolase|nr:bifunctional (p)ppGpp synthetase/guanosine-3',5'-bis(diphosphate) 3'-pyrophosphohydrolase [Bifidobacterium sp.]
MYANHDSELVRRAYAFAKAAHEAVGQLRKYTSDPYIVHPTEVADIVQTVAHTEVMVAAALLHDTVEDTDASMDEIRRLFGHEVADLVEMLTDVSVPTDGNRAVRKAIDRAHTARASAAGKTIKLADLISNTQSIVANDPGFARIYLREKASLMDVLREGDPVLWASANRLLQEGLRTLKLA